MNVPQVTLDHMCPLDYQSHWRNRCEFKRVPALHGWRRLLPSDTFQSGDVTWSDDFGWTEVSPGFQYLSIGVSHEWFRRTWGAEGFL